MMATLKSKTRGQVIFSDLKIADTYWTRMKGLLGTSSIGDDEAMWFTLGNSIHTFFMKYAIDCVFIDRNFKVVSIKENIKPGRLVFPQLRAWSVVEMKAGNVKIKGIHVGEEFHVDN
jgi:uncharacterized protein